MIIKDLLNLKDLEVINKIEVPDRKVENVYIGDLLSWVMGHLEEDSLWLTVQNHLNVIAIAHLHDVAGVVFVEGAYPLKETIDKATESHIPLFIYKGSSYELAIALNGLGL